MKESRTILLGQILRIYNDHNKFIWKNFNTDRVLLRELILEEYGSYIEYIRSEKDIVADALSIFTLNRNQRTTQNYSYQK